MPVVDDGGGGPAWTGTIKVVPGDLEASSPDFCAAGDQVLEIQAATVLGSEPAGVGITDPGAAAAWSRMTTIWTGDLNDLYNGFNGLGGALAGAGASYTTTDDSAIPMVVRGTAISGS